ncbi:hypothetical protein P4O66_017625, partial [Electrophorus voltai]
GKPSVFLDTLPTPTVGESGPGLAPEVHNRGGFLGGSDYGPGSDSAESYRDQANYVNQHSEVNSAGSYDPYMDDYKGCNNCGVKGEYRDVSLWSDIMRRIHRWRWRRSSMGILPRTVTLGLSSSRTTRLQHL